VLQNKVNDLKKSIDDANAAIAGARTPDPTQIAQRDAFQSQYQVAFQALETLNSTGAPAPSMSILQRATAQKATESGLQAPRSKPARAVLLGAIALLLAIGAVLVMQQIDTKVRTKADAERAFGMPVVAEIPALPSGFRHRNEIVTLTRPADPFVEAY